MHARMLVTMDGSIDQLICEVVGADSIDANVGSGLAKEGDDFWMDGLETAA